MRSFTLPSFWEAYYGSLGNEDWRVDKRKRLPFFDDPFFDPSLPRYRRDQAAFRVLIGVGASKGILVLTREEFDRQRTVLTSLPALVEREGRLLHAA